MPRAQEATVDILHAMRSATRTLHAQAERAGFVRELLAGRATRSGYALWLRNLWLTYDALERGLRTLRPGSPLAGLNDARVMRAPSLANDLATLAGPGWRQSLPVLSAGLAYADRVAEAARAGGPRLAAHAYVRYLGDLNGGRILRRVAGTSLGLEDASLRFYVFESEPAALQASYRDALLRAGAELGDPATAADEAAAAFRLNIELSEAVLAATR